MVAPRALITGITGMVGSHLAEFLLERGFVDLVVPRSRLRQELGKLLRAAAELVPEGTTIAIESIRDIPLYDGDVETSAGVPAPVQILKGKIAAADAAVPAPC